MKLSAPPPPPPPPPEDGTPATNAPAHVPPPAAETPSGPVEPAAPKPLTWPAWYSGVDAATAALVLVFAFAAASFVAFNSDVWLHLAAGKRLFAGQYVPGSDPFSYSAADRAWVNHSWLVDAVSYLLYGGEGKVLVVAKALVVALAFGVLIAIRRPQFPLWPWAVTAGVAVLAAAPYFALRPQVVSILFLAVTLFLLFRPAHTPGSWRFPGAVGVTFWLWANCDPWFFVGPAALALLIAGDLIQAKLLKIPDEQPAAGGDEPLGRLPDTVTLAKALGVGVLACMLNPHHVRVWELPFELTPPSGVGIDPRFMPLFYAPTEGTFWSSPSLGYSANGFAYAALVLAGATVLGLAPGRVRAAHVALWSGFAALSLVSVYAVPFFAVVAVPLVAAQLNAVSARVRLKTFGDPMSRVLLIGSSVGRLVSVLAVCAGCVLAYPGWVHPETSNPAYGRRLAWGVEAEPSLARAAEQFHHWREAGALPADARGLIANIDLANYVAWFAPEEKVFVNARFNHHRRELPDYLAVRKGFRLVEVPGEPPNPREATAVLKKANAEYVAVHAGPPGDPQFMWHLVNAATAALYRAPAEWAPWYVDGRTTVFGWRPPGEAGKPAFARLRVDPVVRAFGPDVARVPAPQLLPPLVQLGWEEAFVRPERPAPAGVAEAFGWLQFKDNPYRRSVVRERLGPPFFLGVPSVTGASLHQSAIRTAGESGALRFSPGDASDAAADANAVRAAPLLALRAARRAVAENPDHPDPYYALALVLNDRDLPLTESERVLGRVTALRQCLERLPPPDRYRRGQFVATGFDVASQLAFTFLSPRWYQDSKGQLKVAGFVGMPIDVAPLNELFGQAVFENAQGQFERVLMTDLANPKMRPAAGFRQISDTPFFLPLDAARKTLESALAYARVDLAIESSEQAQAVVKEIQTLHKAVEDAVIRGAERYEQVKGRGLPVMVEVARRSGLIAEALRLLAENDAELPNEFKEALPYALMLRVALEIALGRIETANALLEVMSGPEQTARPDRTPVAARVQMLRYVKAILAGEYKAAGDLWEQSAGVGVGALDALPPPGPGVPRPLVVGLIGGMFGKRTPAEAEAALGVMVAPPLVPLGPLTQTLARQVWLETWYAVADRVRQQVANQLQNEANFFTRRGVLSLLEGDVAAAKQRFVQSTRKAPAGWGLPAVSVPEAQHYMRLIEIAEKKAAAP